VEKRFKIRDLASVTGGRCTSRQFDGFRQAPAHRSESESGTWRSGATETLVALRGNSLRRSNTTPLLSRTQPKNPCSRGPRPKTTLLFLTLEEIEGVF